MRALPAIACALVLSVSSCGGKPPPIPSKTLRTEQLAMSVSAQSNGAAVLLEASLALPLSSQGTLEPSPDEPFFAQAGAAAPRPLAFYARRWLLLLPTTESRVVLELARPGDAVKETLELPPPFTIALPPSPSSRAMPLAVGWSPPAPGSPVSLTVRGPCIPKVERRVASDEGAFTFYPGDFAVAAGTSACVFEIEVRRAITTTKSGALGGARTLAQVRTVEVETVP